MGYNALPSGGYKRYENANPTGIAVVKEGVIDLSTVVKKVAKMVMRGFARMAV